MGDCNPVWCPLKWEIIPFVFVLSKKQRKLIYFIVNACKFSPNIDLKHIIIYLKLKFVVWLSECHLFPLSSNSASCLKKKVLQTFLRKFMAELYFCLVTLNSLFHFYFSKKKDFSDFFLICILLPALSNVCVRGVKRGTGVLQWESSRASGTTVLPFWGKM